MSPRELSIRASSRACSSVGMRIMDVAPSSDEPSLEIAAPSRPVGRRRSSGIPPCHDRRRPSRRTSAFLGAKRSRRLMTRASVRLARVTSICRCWAYKDHQITRCAIRARRAPCANRPLGKLFETHAVGAAGDHDLGVFAVADIALKIANAVPPTQFIAGASACTATHSPPDSAASTAVSSAETRSGSTARIFAPSCAKRSTVARPLPIPSPGLCCERGGLIRPQCRRIIRRHNLDDLIALAGSTRRRGRPTGRLGPSRQPATGRLRQRRRIRRARCGF